MAAYGTALDHVLMEDFVVPTQTEGNVLARYKTPEQRLLIAVIDTACEDYQRYRKSKLPSEQQIHREVTAWFQADDPQHPFSFRSVCDILNLDMGRIRRAVGVRDDA